MFYSFGAAENVFKDRRDAGRQVAAAIKKGPAKSPDFASNQPPVCIALPRGGVPVAEQVAKELGAPMDVLVVRKLGAPHQPEYGVGALAEGGACIVNEDAVHSVGATPEQMAEVLRLEWDELQRRVAVYRSGAPIIDVRGRIVLVVDDGCATGVSARAAMKALRDMGAARIILAVPVGSPDTVAELQHEGWEVLCVHTPPMFRAVGMWYENFGQTEDSEVLAIMERTKAGRKTTGTVATTQSPAGPEDAVQGKDEPPAADMHGGTQGLQGFRRMAPPSPTRGEREVSITAVPGVLSSDIVELKGTLVIPENCTGVVIFAHGSGSSYRSPRNRAVAAMLQDAGMGTLLFDSLSDPEAADRRNVFDIPLLARRLLSAQAWLRKDLSLCPSFPVAFFGASTGGGAAVAAAAELKAKGQDVAAVVSRGNADLLDKTGGRPDLAADQLSQCDVPTLLIVGGLDHQVIDLNKAALARLPVGKGRLEIVEGATHLFEEGNTLEQCARLARDWFRTNFEQASKGSLTNA